MKNAACFMSLTVEWPTPKALYDKLDSEFHFNFDPCPLGGAVDGTERLLNNWKGKRVFCNPPYGPGIRPFLECWQDAELAVYLIPARTDTRWFHDICSRQYSSCRQDSCFLENDAPLRRWGTVQSRSSTRTPIRAVAMRRVRTLCHHTPTRI